nr:clavaldehyde dehydrogenase [Streptomyces clavuligerus]2JAP_A Chain A, Clavaldehyde Dehydrogenase [Streptomyces clavuligerus]2JAP_B Chain B, Clavaldehyde Dehydrogenase [Streptomyces clavuligerus]2JAP_C Chain C, Clavaldehyde Dehydrogenase [Streptomyces clavuligerus]2JAP_D Chain D, Clavaldehyde Dehydrogenase [Streptomyces clavuligerus]
MPSALQGKVALITGASSGIGEATARALAAEGAAVAIAARRVEKLRALGDELTAAGAKVHVLELDVADRQGVDAAVASTVEALGGLDILVNNAGIMLLGPVEDADTTDWTRMIDTNLLGLMYMTRAALPHLLRSKGTVVQMSSIAGRVNVRNAAVYQATKFGVNAFSETLRQEVTERGVRVVVIEPGTTDTELRGHITHTATKEMYEQRISQIRKLQAQDIAEAVRYAVTAPHHATVHEIFIRPTDQV